MGKIDKSKWSGIELFEFFSTQDPKYGKILNQAYLEIGDDIYTLLERAEKEGKKIVLVEQRKGVDDPPLSVEIA